jgi:hypothetical protein
LARRQTKSPGPFLVRGIAAGVITSPAVESTLLVLILVAVGILLTGIAALLAALFLLLAGLLFWSSF